MDEGMEVRGGNKRWVQVRKVVRVSFGGAATDFPRSYPRRLPPPPIRRNFDPTYRDLCHLRAAALAGGFQPSVAYSLYSSRGAVRAP